MGNHSLLQGIFLAQESNLSLLHSQAGSLPLAPHPCCSPRCELRILCNVADSGVAGGSTLPREQTHLLSPDEPELYPSMVFTINEPSLSASCSLRHGPPPQLSQSSYIIQVTAHIQNTHILWWSSNGDFFPPISCFLVGPLLQGGDFSSPLCFVCQYFITSCFGAQTVPDLAPGSAFKMVPYPLTCSHPSWGRPCGQTKEDISSCSPRSGFESFPTSDLKTAVTLRAPVPFTGERVLEIKNWIIGLLVTTCYYCLWALLSRQSEVNISAFIHPSSYLSSAYTDASNVSLQGLL